MAPIAVTDRQREILQNVASYAPPHARSKYLQLVAELLRDKPTFNDRVLAEVCNTALKRLGGARYERAT
jgi:hypothetical protein